MTTFIPFQPSPTEVPPFVTTVTLDGNGYTLITQWNFYRGGGGQGQGDNGGWYLTLTDQDGNPIVTRPLTGSPTEADINLVWGYFFTSTLIYRQTTGNFEVTP